MHCLLHHYTDLICKNFSDTKVTQKHLGDWFSPGSIYHVVGIVLLMPTKDTGGRLIHPPSKGAHLCITLRQDASKLTTQNAASD